MLPYGKDSSYVDIVDFRIYNDLCTPTYQKNEGYIFSGASFPQDTIKLSLLFDMILYIKDITDKSLRVEVKKISSEYYQYQHDIAQYYQTINNPFGEPFSVYSNIYGGYGIFAAYNSQGFDLPLKLTTNKRN